MPTPLVTIACITYNHAPFIEQCIEGFLMQKVNFEYEIVIHDDASSDGTQEILKRYRDKYPDKIKLILRDFNLYSLGVTKIFYHGVIKHSKAKYIACCEGDDYWIDEHKLQKQVDFLEANEDYNFSCGRIKIYHQDKGSLSEKTELVDPSKKDTYTIKDYLKVFFSKTPTFVFRREGYDMPSYCNRYFGEDILMVVLGTRHGKIKFHNDYFAMYRVHVGGVTQLKYNWKMQYHDIYNYTQSLYEILGRKFTLVFTSIKWRIWLDYKTKEASNGISRFLYKGLSFLNNQIRWKFL